jgi:tetratricopeptide (TPR) repeat protein
MLWRVNMLFRALFLALMAILSLFNLYSLEEWIYKFALKKWSSRRVELLGDLGNVYERSGKLEEARKCFEQALELKPEDAFRHIMLGDFYEKQHKVSLAIEYYEKGLQFGNDFGEALRNRIISKIDHLKACKPN